MRNPAFAYSEVSKLLRYDPETGVLFWKPRGLQDFSSLNACASWNGKHANKPAFKMTKDGYRRGQLFGWSCAAHRVAWLLHYGDWPTLAIDHIDGNRDNNRIDNLRLATQSQNNANRSATGKTSSYKGVCYCPARKSWRASLIKDGKQVFHGRFRDEIEAARAYDAAAMAHFGEFSRTNLGTSA